MKTCPSLPGRRLPSSSAPTVRPVFRGDEYVQRLGGARQGHVEQIDVVHMGIDQLAVVFGREARFGHRPLVADREAADGLGLPVAAGLGPDDVLHAARLRVELPRAVGDDHGPLLEPLGLVDRGDLDRRSALLDAQRAVLALFVPPAQEQGDVGDLRRAEAITCSCSACR